MNRLQEKANQQLQSFISDCQVADIKDKSILEFGFKNGCFLNECQKAGANPVGLEVVESYYNNTKKDFPDLDLVLYDGNHVPLDDKSCDYIVSFQVLEHVGSIETVISESFRLLKPGGIMYHICPNYKSFYEGHYKTIWLPFLTKKTGRTYLKLLKKYTEYYESLNIVKPKEIKNILKQYNNANTISLGVCEFENNFSNTQIEKINNPKVKKCLKLINYTGPLKWAFIKTLSFMGLYYPLTIIVKKNK